MQGPIGGFVRSYVLPALFLFAVPLAAYLFAGHEIRSLDADYRFAALASTQADQGLTEEVRAEVRSFFQAVSFSSMCRGEATQTISEAGMKEVCPSYRVPEIAKSTALFGLLLGLLSVVVVAACGAVSFLSRGSQYASFVIGWNYLRVASSLQTVLQGALAVWLSYAMTALWFNRYSPKLILVVAAVAALAAFAVIRAIFQRVGGPLFIEGEPIDERKSPELWKRVRDLCRNLETTPPQQIIAGIDDNFFVTESDVSVQNQLSRGRTLYVSLSLLRAMERREADAVLAHEMAHFSGGDTQYSKKLAPGLNRFDAYLDALRTGWISLPVFYFMQFYWAVLQLSLKRFSREREFAADAVAKAQTSADSVARALLKVAAYCSYRRRVEGALFNKDASHTELGIASRVASGFSSYARSNSLAEDLARGRFPHPFDSHPPLTLRIEALGASPRPDDFEIIVSEPVSDSWLTAVDGADEIERRLWQTYEARFAAAHDRSLAYRYLPATPEQEAHVVRYFPKVEIFGAKDGPVLLDFRGLELQGSGVRVAFSDIKKVEVGERLFKKHLDIRTAPGANVKKLSVCISDLNYDKDAFVALFGEYYGRHQAAVAERGARG